MKKYRKLVIIAIVLAALALLGYWLTRTPDPIDFVADALEVQLPRGEVLETVETHGGFHGDGETYIVIRFEEDISHRLVGEFWHDLPMSEGVSTCFYGRETETMTYGAHVNDGAGFADPITNGRYYFCDRHSRAVDPADDSQLFDRGSFNYTAAIYDADTCTLYYFKFDT